MQILTVSQLHSEQRDPSTVNRSNKNATRVLAFQLRNNGEGIRVIETFGLDENGKWTLSRSTIYKI